jgi:pyruvate dehydrogenase E2 component (dihydrolipoamide acetyltransferase)
VALVAQEIPKIGLVMESARLVRWLKNVGDTVTEGEPLLELETEKTVLTIEATVSGRLVQVLLESEQEARVGDQIAWVESDVASGASGSPLAAKNHTSAPDPDQPSAPATPRPSSASPSADAPYNGRVRSSPVARRLSAQHGLDLARIAGTGPRGRVQLDDVRRVLTSQSAQQASMSAGPLALQLSSMRRAIARAMTLSNATVPQFTVARAVDWTALQAARSRIGASLPAGSPKISVNDFLLQALARALLAVPAMNATFSGDPDLPEARIVRASGAHIGLVVALEDGLLVPVLHGVEKLGLAELARRRGGCVERALTGGLRRKELEGATISISNLGTHGPDRFTALVNPPQSAILAVGRQRDCVVARDGGIHIRPMSELTLTVDHRVADGRLASDFLAQLVEILEGDEWRT